MRLILDTATFIWAVSTPERLSRAAMAALRKGTAVREISVVSMTEIALEQTRGKLTFGRADALAGVADLRLRVLPYTAEHAFRLFDLPAHHADPFDRSDHRASPRGERPGRDAGRSLHTLRRPQGRVVTGWTWQPRTMISSSVVRHSLSSFRAVRREHVCASRTEMRDGAARY